MNEKPQMVRDEHGLALVDGKTVVRGDFTRMLPRLRPGNLGRELLVRAAKLKGAGDHPLVIDATAGLGEDSLLLAAAGFRVVMFERNPTIHALLADALDRARAVPELAETVSRMQLLEGDSVPALQRIGEAGQIGERLAGARPGIVLLDPMFPGKHNRAAAKKKLQLIQQLEEPCNDEAELLDAAITANPRKIIVKRPAKGPHLADRKPSYTLTGKAIRFDIIVLPT